MTLVAGLTYDPTARLDVSTRDVVYRKDGEREFLATIYEPVGAGPFPMLVNVHGGAWSGSNRLTDASLDEEIARGGAVVASVDFRTSMDAPHPAAMQDINYAVRWLKAHASEFNGSPEAFGIAGWSSGGHQVMLLAMRPRNYADIPLAEAPGVDASIAYVIMGWPVIDPLSRYRFSQEILLQDATKENMVEQHITYFGSVGAMDAENPQRMLERGESVELPPALLLQGSADARITRLMAERFVDTYSQAGGVIELGKYPGAGHSFLRNPGDNSTRAWGLLKSFIARQLAAE